MVSTDDAERYVIGVKTEVAIARVRSRVAALHVELFRHGLRVATVSERVPGAELFLIRPAVSDADEPAPEQMVLTDLDGAAVPETPGSDRALTLDAEIHAGLYAAASRIGAVVHLESGHVAAWAARGEAIPCLTTAMADEFGAAVPVVGAPGDGDAAAIARSLADAFGGGLRAALVQHRGAFVVGPTAKDAVRAALMLDDSARTATLASLAGAAEPLDPDIASRRFAASQALRTTATDDRR